MARDVEMGAAGSAPASATGHAAGHAAGEPASVRAFAPLLSAAARVEPEDFTVDEVFAGAGPPPLDGEGEHLWLHVRKRLMTTDEVAAALGERLGVRVADVGHAGMKDRRAVTTQWFSVRTTGADAAGPADAGALGEGTWEVLSGARHSRKLRRGAHAGNRFRLVLRDIDWHASVRGDPWAALRARVDEVRRHGFANRFGPQRFGHGGGNVARALAMFAEAGPLRGGRGRARRRGAAQRGMLLSAARSAIFNAVLDERVRRGDWRAPLAGEPLVLAGSGSFFVPTAAELDPEAEASGAASARGCVTRRLAGGDVSTSGPMHGGGEPPARGACAAFESALVAADATLARLAAGLEAADVAVARRPLVARAPDLEAGPEGDAAVLSFTLGPGAFATALLEAFGEVRAASPSASQSIP